MRVPVVSKLLTRDYLPGKKRSPAYPKLKYLCGHPIYYVLVVAGLSVSNPVSYPDYIWAKRPAMSWGSGIIVHGLWAHEVFKIFFGSDRKRMLVEKRQ